MLRIRADGPSFKCRPALAENVELLWLTEPRRTTCLATVTDVRGHEFRLDRCLFAPASKTHRHPQPADSGTLWIQGEKRRLERVHWRDGGLWHRLRGTVPPKGATLQCHLDTDRREAAARAHTGMHLVMAALWKDNGPALTADPQVKGGGSFRLELDAAVAPARLAGLLTQANAWAVQGRSIVAEPVPRGQETHRLDVQRFQPPDPYPGPPDVVHAVRIDGVCCYPCDGTLVDSTRRLGRIVFANASARRNGMTLVGKVT